VGEVEVRGRSGKITLWTVREDPPEADGGRRDHASTATTRSV
jgi:hypothetical protein